MKVFKFGGGILNSPESIRLIPVILERFPGQDLLLVISAFGKSTNALEKIIHARKSGLDHHPFSDRLIQDHLAILLQLFPSEHPVFKEFNDFSGKLEEALDSIPSGNDGRDYDRLVSFGELIASGVVHHFLEASGYPNRWADAREIIVTDLAYQDATVDLEYSRKLAGLKLNFPKQGQRGSIIVTQGFIAGGIDGSTTTLGREGSDYSAAIFANLLDAEEVIIWKDVPGILNADPMLFPDPVKLDRISYAEATELAYYGAKVIHPKTTKPLQNKNIPLWVKSFFHPSETGTLITSSAGQEERIPSFILKNDQVLVSVSTSDLSFISGKVFLDVFALLNEQGIKVNILQNSALTLSFCMDDRGHAPMVLEKLQEKYIVRYNQGLTLLTVRHHTPEAISRGLQGREVLLEQQNRTVAQFVVR